MAIIYHCYKLEEIGSGVLKLSCREKQMYLCEFLEEWVKHVLLHMWHPSQFTSNYVKSILTLKSIIK